MDGINEINILNTLEFLTGALGNDVCNEFMKSPVPNLPNINCDIEDYRN